MSLDPHLAKDLKKADLRYVSDTIKGITRKKAGKNFIYFDPQGKKISYLETIERIQHLTIPPAWKDVWICPSPTGYIQSTGIDDKGRKQYIYHPDWVTLSQENKFNKILSFATFLPKIREKIYRDMSEESLEKDKIIATVIWLLEHTLIRIGNEEYAKENDSFGLTTLRNRHVTIKGKEVQFEFRGKSGVEHTVSINHPKIAHIIKECIELPGYEIFQYINPQGERHAVDSQDVNEYLQQITNEDITAKDFRTWAATVLGATTLHHIGPAVTLPDIKKNIIQTVKKVSQHLHNTEAVCKAYYIHPTVLKTYEKSLLIPHFEYAYRTYPRAKTRMNKGEFATYTLLAKYA
jgi:DNA topoisomerase-1